MSNNKSHYLYRMYVSGFTFIRNAIKYDYPIVEAIQSILPLCDEVVVAVGNSEDGTRALIENIGSPKIRIINTVWDDNLREGGRVLALETQKAYDAINPKTDWAIYIQGDEVLHEDSLDAVRKSMLTYAADSRVEGLLFDYVHFYGSYDYVGASRQWYRKEVRVVRPRGIQSYRDAQGFRKDGQKLRVKHSGGTIHHYGWVKAPDKQQAKQHAFHRLWHGDEWLEENVGAKPEFDYSQIDALAHFKGKHPQVMQERINRINWQFAYDPTLGIKTPLKYRIANFIESLTGWRVGEYRNYRF